MDLSEYGSCGRAWHPPPRTAASGCGARTRPWKWSLWPTTCIGAIGQDIEIPITIEGHKNDKNGAPQFVSGAALPVEAS